MKVEKLIEILEGLPEGSEVAVAPLFNISPGINDINEGILLSEETGHYCLTLEEESIMAGDETEHTLV